MTNDILKYKLLHQYKEAEDLIKDLELDFILKRHHEEKWSIHENLSHLGRYQEIFLERISSILKEDKPAFGRYVAEEDSSHQLWVEKSTFEVVMKSKTTRQEIIKLIMNLAPSDKLKTGSHPKLGDMNINRWMIFFLLHESHHIYTVFKLIEEFKK